MVNFYSQQNRHIDPGEPAPKIDTLPKKTRSGHEKYVDPTGEFGAKEFQRAVWFVKHKLLLYRMLVIFLIVFSAATLGFSVWRGFNLLMFDLTGLKNIEAELSRSVDYAALHPRFNPLPLEVLSTYILPGGTDKVDAVSEITNPNLRHVVRFEYYYDFGGVASARQAGFLLPGESRMIGAFGLNSTQFAGSPDLIIGNIRYTRVSAHDIPDIGLWQEERLNFSVDNFSFVFIGEEGQSAHAVRFTLTNGSAYGYKNPAFLLGLYQNQGLVGVMPFDLTDFQSLESRRMDLRNFVDSIAVSEIRVFPVIDLYNKEVYLPPKR